MVKAAEAAAGNGVRSMVGFNYRRVPRFVRPSARRRRLAGQDPARPAVYLQDWIVDAEFPLVWRLQKGEAGSGALGDIASHIVDLSQFITGQPITGVGGLTETFVTERPLVASTEGLGGKGSTSRRGHGRRRRTVRRPAVRRRRRDVRGDPVRARTRNGLRIELNGEKG